MSIKSGNNSIPEIIVQNTPPSNPSHNSLWLDSSIDVADSCMNTIDLNRFTSDYNMLVNESGLLKYANTNSVRIPVKLNEGIYSINISMYDYKGASGPHKILVNGSDIDPSSVSFIGTKSVSGATNPVIESGNNQPLIIGSDTVLSLQCIINTTTISKTIKIQGVTKSGSILTSKDMFLLWNDVSTEFKYISLSFADISSGLIIVKRIS